MTSEASFCISHMKYSFSYIILKTNEKHESFLIVRVFLEIFTKPYFIIEMK